MTSTPEARDAALQLVGHVTSALTVLSLAATGALVGALSGPSAAPAPAATASSPGPVPHPRRTVLVRVPVPPPVIADRASPPRRTVVRPAAPAPKRAVTPPVATSGSS
jgi:hypothetical protein